ncbi:hypothetical protein GOODEAATRI_027230 [Goodea atripinnis]|uniref:Uncharacterized protein n=1 Tax=Goodea atripinnis TaxID=208336 RepID=A0ABV0N7W6_9TELE
MLKKISSEEVLEDRSTPELDALKHRDWVRRDDRVHLETEDKRSSSGRAVTLTDADVFLLFLHQARLWVQLMKDLRQGVKLKKVQEQPFNPLPTEFSLTPFEMLMQDIRARKFQLRKVMVRVVGSLFSARFLGNLINI